jgi:hypothetical protein
MFGPQHRARALAAAGLIVCAATLATLGLLGGRSSDRPHSTHKRIIFGLISASLPASTACGSWATSPTDAVAMSIAQAAGPIARCELLGDTWVIVTAGVATPSAATPQQPPPEGAAYSQPGAIATYQCAQSDAECLSATSPHPFNSWAITPFPTPGFLQIADVLTPTVLVAEATFGQVMFNVATNTWITTGPSPSLTTCGQEWGAYVDTTQASSTPLPVLSAQQTFIAAHPECTDAAG